MSVGAELELLDTVSVGAELGAGFEMVAVTSLGLSLAIGQMRTPIIQRFSTSLCERTHMELGCHRTSLLRYEPTECLSEWETPPADAMCSRVVWQHLLGEEF